MESMEEIYRRYMQTVYRYLLSMTHDSDLAEELTQETFYQAVKSVHRYDESCKVSTWLCAIAKNVLFSYYRKHPTIDSLDDEAQRNHAAPSSTSPSAESQVLHQLDRVTLMRALHQCPDPYREVLYLRLFGDLSFREIGDIMGRMENWARITFYRGKEYLRKELDEDGTWIML